MEGQAAALGTGGGPGILMMIVMFVVSGLIVGALARLALPGKDAMSIGRTILYGIGGSMLGGIVSTLIGVRNPIVSLVIAIAVAAGLIWFFTRRVPKASNTTTGSSGPPPSPPA